MQSRRDCRVTLQSVKCESGFLCEAKLQGESYNGVCFGQFAAHFSRISILFSIIDLRA